MSKAKKPRVDGITRKKLLYAKQFYQHGEEHARRPEDSFQRIVAIHQFHAAVEIALKAVYAKYASLGKIERTKGKKGLKQLYFEELLKAIKPHCSWITVFWEDFLMNKLDERRHMAQHEAEPIAAEHLLEYQVHTKDFLDECFLKEFGVKFDELDLVDSVNDSKLRQVLVWAKELIELEKYEDSVAFSKLVFKVTLLGFPWLLPCSYPLNSDISRIKRRFYFRGPRGGSEELPEFSGFSEDVSKVLERLAEEINESAVRTLIVGETKNIENYYRFKSISPSDVSWTVKHEVFFRSREDTSKESAEWVRDYVIGCLLRLQSRGLDVEWGEGVSGLFEWAKSQIEAKRKKASQ